MADVTPIDDAPRRRTAVPEPLWREVLGRRLRDLRADRGQTLVDTAKRAGISPQYLSEMERGLKEPSSEMISAVVGALDTSLAEVASDVGRDLERRAVAAQPQRAVVSLAA
jgi:transcriptional regulator with XRE-family HTH domain